MFNFFLEATPEIQGGTVEAYADLLCCEEPEGRSGFLFLFLGAGRKLPCSLPAEQCVHRGHIRQARRGTPPQSRVCKNHRESLWHRREKCWEPSEREQNKQETPNPRGTQVGAP